MQKELTANRLSGMATGVMFATGFGSGWLFWSLIARQKIAAGTATGVGMGTLVLLAAAAYVMRQAKRWPRVADVPGTGRAFAWINAIQWSAVAVVVFGSARMHWDAYVPSAITAIVGLHFYPLARLFRSPMHYVTGTVLVAWAVVSALIVPADQLQGAAALGTGAILWASAAVVLGRAMLAMRVGAVVVSG
ncbi:MAG: hypothetical protein ABSF23_05600 [Terracidiphilus sp.]|jgi:hypothetical protein